MRRGIKLAATLLAIFFVILALCNFAYSEFWWGAIVILIALILFLIRVVIGYMERIDYFTQQLETVLNTRNVKFDWKIMRFVLANDIKLSIEDAEEIIKKGRTGD